MKLAKAPIREAVFDIRIDKLLITNPEDLHQFKKFLGKNFPLEKRRHNVKGTIQLQKGSTVGSEAHSNLDGFVYLSNDKKRQIQIRMDGFTMNVLKPYEDWNTHFEIFWKYWELYSSLFKPNKVTRIAARFINRIEIPLPFEKLEEFLNIIPPIPTSLPKNLRNFFLQIHVPCNDGLRDAVLTQTLEPISENKLPVIVDIDVFQTFGTLNDLSNLKENFTQIREIKNEIFLNCITEKTLNLFK